MLIEILYAKNWIAVPLHEKLDLLMFTNVLLVEII